MKRVGSRYPAYRRKRRGGAFPIATNLASDEYKAEDRKISDFANLDVKLASTLYTQLSPFALQVLGLTAKTDEEKKDPWGNAVTQLVTQLKISDNAPGDFKQYLPWFMAYDILQIKATNPQLDERTKIAYIKLSELMRTLPPKQEIKKFSRWEEYYKDFKDGLYSGGKETWLYNKRATTPYDPTDPLFHFTPQRSRIEVRGASPSLYGDYDVMRILNVKPEGSSEDRYKQGPFVGTGWKPTPLMTYAGIPEFERQLMGGRMRRRVPSSRRRI